MTPPPRRLLLAVAALAALVASACGSFRPAAATINGTEVSMGDLDGELRAIRGNRPYVEAVESPQRPVLGQGKGTFDAAYTADVLTRRIYFELIRQEVGRRGLEVGKRDLQEARGVVVRQMAQVAGGDPEQGEAFLRGFPEDYRDTLVSRQAEVAVLLGDLAAKDVEEAEARRFLEENRRRLIQVCASHILVATREAADAVRAELAAGADFAQLAEGRSTDPSAKQNRGNLGCTNPEQYVPEFADAVTTLPVGQVSEAVQTQFGFHVIRVDERREPAPDDVREILADQKLDERLRELLADATISVNPRFGRFDRSLPQPRVVPPQAPTTLPAQPAPSPLPAPAAP